MNESIKALASGAVKIVPTKFSWELAGGGVCEARLLSGTAQQLLGMDIRVQLAIALPAMQSLITLGLYHIISNEYSWASIEITEIRESSNLDYDTHRKNIEAILCILKIPLKRVCLDLQENHMSDDNFGFAWSLTPIES